MKITTILLAAGIAIGATTAIGQEQMLPVTTQEQAPSVTDQELEKFATIYQEVQSKNQELQKEAVEVIQSEGMEIERFNEISQAQNDPNSAIETSQEEQAQLTKINTQMQEIQTEFQTTITELIQEEGLTVKRYQEVYAALQQDTELQKKLGELINS